MLTKRSIMLAQVEMEVFACATFFSQEEPTTMCINQTINKFPWLKCQAQSFCTALTNQIFLKDVFYMIDEIHSWWIWIPVSLLRHQNNAARLRRHPSQMVFMSPADWTSTMVALSRIQKRIPSLRKKCNSYVCPYAQNLSKCGVSW